MEAINNWHIIIALIIGVYEVITRVIPSVSNYSLIAKVIDILKFISDYFNKKKER